MPADLIQNTVASPAGDARREYTRRLEARRKSADELERRHRVISHARLATVVAGVVLVLLSFRWHAVSIFWIAMPAAVFVALVFVHDRIGRLRAGTDRAVAFYERALARLDGHWMGAGETGERFANPAHPYADDLDLFGKGSLFELLSTARTDAGQRALAGWLLAPASPEVICARQAAIAELRSRLDLREDLGVLEDPAQLRAAAAEALAAWGEQAALLESRWARPAAALFSTFGVLGVAAWAAGKGPDLLLLVVVASATIFWRFRGRLGQTAEAADAAARGLDLLSGVLARIERETFTAPRLVQLHAALSAAGRPPSARIAMLGRLVNLLDSRHHWIVELLDPVILWTLQLAFCVESWRKHSGPSIRRWLDAAGEIEALCALAGYAYEHPADPFPEFAESSANPSAEQRPLFDGVGIAHPLLDERLAVRNDLRLGGDISVDEVRLLVVSGSNMSGKSTLLRTIGVNAVLAQCGAPVRATRLRLSPLAIGASIHIRDSLQEGTSRFYAEITRLRQIVNLTRGAAPLLFLLDEFLQGTNSHDRRIGAEAIVRSLVERNAIGLLTTHDLALAEIADTLGPRAANVHFEDHLEDGKLCFDYRLRPGVVQKSNALELMRSIGLDVGRDSD